MGQVDAANEMHVGVIDIGKTNAKVAVVDAVKGEELALRTRPNTVRTDGPYPHFDADGLWTFILESLSTLHKECGIDALSVTTHGAAIVLLDTQGALAAPILDYEFDGPESLAAHYDAVRPAFAQTGSPKLGVGLNVGAQLFWQFRSDPGLSSRVGTVLTYPQYWSYRLSGIPSNEVTSLGAHTDLWCPGGRCYSSLVEGLGLVDKMAPLRSANDCLGPVLPDVAAQTGLRTGTPVYCGIHDSNASLYPHLLKRKAPFTVVSSGTWMIALAIGGKKVELDPTKDTLTNVNALGEPVPSARFMAGREFDTVMKGHSHSYSDMDIASVLDRGVLLQPSVDPISGPFQGRQHAWSVDESQLTEGERYVAVSFYLALMTAECLSLIGADGPIIVEGPFARNPLYLDMLEQAALHPCEPAGHSLTGTSVGAACLAHGVASPTPSSAMVAVEHRSAFQHYAQLWQTHVARLGKIA